MDAAPPRSAGSQRRESPPAAYACVRRTEMTRPARWASGLALCAALAGRSSVPATRAAVPRLPSCAERSVSLTGGADEYYSWSYGGGLAFEGRAAVVVCEGEDEVAASANLSRLLEEVGRFVRDNGFGMPWVCHPELAARYPTGPTFLAEHQRMIARFNAVMGRPAIRRLDCSFGWSHSDDEGHLVSGLSH
jgi:hypothetical protein